MLFEEAVRKKLTKIKLNNWAKGCWLELSYLNDSLLPWAVVYDPSGSCELSVFNIYGSAEGQDDCWQEYVEDSIAKEKNNGQI